MMWNVVLAFILYLEVVRGFASRPTSPNSDNPYTIQSGDNCWDLMHKYHFDFMTCGSDKKLCCDGCSTSLDVGQVCAFGTDASSCKNPFTVDVGDNCDLYSSNCGYTEVVCNQNGEEVLVCPVAPKDLWLDTSCTGFAAPSAQCTVPAFTSKGKQADDLEQAGQWPGKKVVLYWMPDSSGTCTEDLCQYPPDALLKRATHVLLAFGTTYSFHYPWGDADYDCDDKCELDQAFPVAQKDKLIDYVNHFKAKSRNPNLKVYLSFGGWNQGPGEAKKNCYEESTCYTEKGMNDLVTALKNLPCIDGVDLDYEMSDDLKLPDGPGIKWLQQMTKRIKDAAPQMDVSQAPQPPYFPPENLAEANSGTLSYSNGVLMDQTMVSSKWEIDLLNVQYYNNPNYHIQSTYSESQNILHQYQNIVKDMNNDPSRVVLGMCYIDCNPGYSAVAYDSDGSLSKVQGTKQVIADANKLTGGFGGIAMWTNPVSKHNPPNVKVSYGGVSDIAQWLDMINPSA